jgi:cyclin L
MSLAYALSVLMRAEYIFTNMVQDVSATALYLVSKMGPLPRSPRDVSNVYTYLLSDTSALFSKSSASTNNPSSYYQTEADYYQFQSRMLALEGRILGALSFDTHVAVPHPLAITYLQALDFLGHPKAKLSRRTIEYLNTALLSPQLLYLTHQPNALATAAIYNAAKDAGAKMPECEWWEVFDVEREELGFLVVGMRSVEGWAITQREKLPSLGKGMITRKMIDNEMTKRGIHVGNGNSELDEETQMAMMMDEKSAAMAES